MQKIKGKEYRETLVMNLFDACFMCIMWPQRGKYKLDAKRASKKVNFNG